MRKKGEKSEIRRKKFKKKLKNKQREDSKRGNNEKNTNPIHIIIILSIY
jgi:hypothetical protein